MRKEKVADSKISGHVVFIDLENYYLASENRNEYFYLH